MTTNDTTQRLTPEQEVEAIVGTCLMSMRLVRKIRRELSESHDVHAAIRRALQAQEYLGARLSEIGDRWGPFPRVGIPKVALQLELDGEEYREAIRRGAHALEEDEDCPLVAEKLFARCLEFETSRLEEDVYDARTWLAQVSATRRHGPARDAA